MATRFWVGGTGTWDASDTTHWAATSGTAGGQSVPVSGDTVTFDASSGGGTVTVAYNPTITSITMGAFTGTLDMNTRNPSMATFSCSGTGTRTLTMGSGTWTLTGNAATIWDTTTTTNLTFSATTAIINCSYSGATGTRTFTPNINFTLPTLNITAGTDTFNMNGSIVTNINFTGFSGTWGTGGAITLKGNLTLGTGMTAINANTLTLTATSGTQVITSNSVTLDRPITFNGQGATFQFADTFVGGATRAITLTAGILDANNKDITFGTFTSNGTATRTITMGSGTWKLAGTGTVWTIGSQTGLTFNKGSGVIKITDTSNTAITFSGINLTYNNIWFSRGASTATNTIVTNNVFNDFKDDGSAAHTIAFTASSNTTVTTFTVSGSAGNLITLNSTVGGTAWTLTKASGVVSRDYISIQDSHAVGGANFYAGSHSTNTSGNTGWQFFAYTNPITSDFFFARTV